MGSHRDGEWRNGSVVRGLRSVPAPTWQLTTISNYSSRGFNFFFWLHWAPGMHCAHTFKQKKIHTHKFKKIDWESIIEEASTNLQFRQSQEHRVSLNMKFLSKRTNNHRYRWHRQTRLSKHLADNDCGSWGSQLEFLINLTLCAWASLGWASGFSFPL